MRTDHVLPRYSYAHKQAAWHRADEVASVRLRYAATDWTIDDADAWLDNELLKQCPSPFVTAAVMHDRCLMRVRTGLRIEAAIDDRAWSTPVEPRTVGRAERVVPHRRPATATGHADHAPIRRRLRRVPVRARYYPRYPSSAIRLNHGVGLAGRVRVLTDGSR